MNASLISRIDSIISSTQSSDVSSGSTFIQNEISRLKSGLGYVYEEKKFAPGEQPTQDHMIVSLLSQVVKSVKEDEEKSGNSGDEKGRTERIVKALEWHKSRLLQRQEEIEKEKVDIDIEQKKWITSEDIRDGWDSKTVCFSLFPFSLTRGQLSIQVLTISWAVLDGLFYSYRPTKTFSSRRFFLFIFVEQTNENRNDQLTRCPSRLGSTQL